MIVRPLPALLCLGQLTPTLALADEPSSTLTVYMLGIGIDGHASAGVLSADVDVSASKVLESLEFGAMGSYRLDQGPWSFQVDAMYASLSGEKQGSQGLARAVLDLDQTMIEVDGGYAVSGNVELFAGLRYWDIQPDITLYGASTMLRSQAGKDWIDPLVGLRVTAPLGDHWDFVARADIGGFGVGSDFTWHATVHFDWNIDDRISLLLGYRIFDLDFNDGGASGRVDVDLRESGPGLGVAFSF